MGWSWLGGWGLVVAVGIRTINLIRARTESHTWPTDWSDCFASRRSQSLNLNYVYMCNW